MFKRYRKKPVVVEACQWFCLDDLPGIVKPYRSGKGNVLCKHCDWPLEFHGWVETLECGHIVCPGDYIIKGVKGEYYPCKPDIFNRIYEPAEEQNEGD